MGACLRRVRPAWAGVVLAVLGVLVFVVSYVLLPVVVTYCFGSCARYYGGTVWQYSLFAVAAWRYEDYSLPEPQLFFSLLNDTILLVLYYLPLLAAVTVVGCSVGFLVRPHRAFATWGHRAWRTGSIALALMLLWVLFATVFYGGGPYLGFLGLLVGYGVLWAGTRVLLTARP